MTACSPLLMLLGAWRDSACSSRRVTCLNFILAMIIEEPGCGSMGVLVKHRSDGRVSCCERVMRYSAVTGRITSLTTLTSRGRSPVPRNFRCASGGRATPGSVTIVATAAD